MPLSRSARLASFIKDALAVRLKPVTDVAEYSQPRGPIWFGGLPLDGSSCRSVFAHSTTGDAWIALRRRKEPAKPTIPATCRGWVDEPTISATTEPVLALERDAEDGSGRLSLADAPSVASAWAAWVEAQWRPWAREHLAWEEHHRLYQSVFQARERLVGQEDTMEVLLGLGFLQWAHEQSPPIRRHLITFRGELALDPGTGELAFRFAPDGYQPQVELDMLPNMSSAILTRALGTPQEMVRDIDGLIDLAPIHDLLSRIANTLSGSLEYRQGLDKGDSNGLFFAPACYFRKKGVRGLESLLAAILKDDPTQHSPLWRGLAEEDEGSDSPVEPGQHNAQELPFIYFPAPSNNEQQQIARRAAREPGLVVQGPPGTGKSHTIANLISHLLATGERVLVTAHTSQALQVLKTKLDKDLQALCVSLLGTGSEGSVDLERSVHGILQQLAQHNPGALNREAQEAEATARDLEIRQAQLDTRLARAREAEARSVEPVMGYAGTCIQLAERVLEEAQTRGWIPGRVDPDREPDLETLPPLLTYHASLDANVRHEAQLPALDLPTNDELQALVADFNALQRSVSSRQSTAVSLPSDHESLLDLVDLLRGWYQAARHDGPWAERALVDCLHNRRSVWDILHQDSSRRVDTSMNEAKLRQAPAVSVDDGHPMDVVIEHARALHAHVSAGGGKSTMVIFTPAVVKETAYILDAVRIDGSPIAHLQVARLSKAILGLEVAIAVEKLTAPWAVRGHRLEPQLPPRQRVASIKHSLELLGRLLTATTASTTLTPESRGLLADLTSPSDLDSLASGLRYKRDESSLATIRARLDGIVRALRAATQSREQHRAYQTLAEALDRRDAAFLASTLDEVNAFLERRRSYDKYRQSLDRIRAMAPQLADDIEATEGSPVWRARCGAFADAWRHAQVRSWLREHQTEAILEDADALRRQRERAVAKATVARAWGHALARLDMSAQRRLVAWQQAAQMVPRGPQAKTYATRRAAAQRTLEACLDAVPAWVLPLSRLYDMVSTKACQFDTVIVDEASQCGLDSLVLLHLARRIIVVGDDKQVSPLLVGVDVERIQALRSTHLPDFAHGHFFVPDFSLFGHASRCFPQRLALREHFRCVPRIIEFSNRLSYNSSPLIPLRQPDGDALPPLMKVYVSEGARTGELNIPEARAVVKQIVTCHSDPAYDGMTFGVVCLQGHDQAAEIERLLMDALDQQAWDERQLRCGSPSDFQGDERDVMFLSMVAAPNVTNATFSTPPYERSFNVAMSRARDQVWLFHSVKMDDLSSQCLRRKLLSFFSEPPPQLDEPDWAGLRLKATATQRRHAIPPEPFDSWFEVDVALRLWDRGYRVLPQVEAGRYRIDLVLEYDDARLAVECDGDAFHGIDRFQADLSRQRMLERAGWRFVRIPGSRFYADPDHEIDGVARMASDIGVLTRAEIESSKPLEQAVATSVQATVPTSSSQTAAASAIVLDEPRFQDVEDDEEDVEETSCRAADDVASGTGPFTQYSKALAFPAPDAPSREIAEAVLKIVALDGPLPKASVYRLYVQGCPNVARAAIAVRRAANKAIHWLEQAGKLTVVDEGRWRRPEDQVVRIAGSGAVLVRDRGYRQPEDIPLSELAERLRKAGALTPKSARERDAVLRQAQRAAGFDRLGASVRKRLEAAWSYLERM